MHEKTRQYRYRLNERQKEKECLKIDPIWFYALLCRFLNYVEDVHQQLITNIFLIAWVKRVCMRFLKP